MRIARIGQPGFERPVAITDDGTAYDLAEITDDIDGSFLAAGGIDRVRAALSSNELPPFFIAGQRLPGTPYLRAGDNVRLSIAGLGEQEQTIGAA